MSYADLVCEPCGETVFTATPHRNVMGLGANLVRCSGCGVKRYDRRLADAAAVNDSAEAHTLADNVARFGALNNLDAARIPEFQAAHWRLYTGMVATLRRFAGTLASIYEVGTSVGEFLAVAHACHVATLDGCEPNRRACELAASLHGLAIEHSFFGAATPPRAPYDAVAMLDVIEHTETPRGDLEKAFGILRPGGMLLLKTFYDEWHATLDLNIAGPDAWTDPRHGYFDPLGHLHHFDEPVLRSLIERVGFAVEDWSRNTVHGQVIVYARRPC